MKKKNWQINEVKCVEYLNNHFGTNIVSFEGKGGFDSTESDIIVLKNGIRACYIEAKMPKSQCGQFVLFPNKENRKFESSRKNRPSEPSLPAEEIIEAMDANFDCYCNPSGSNNLDMDQQLFYSWIIDHYKYKKVEYFIVSTGNDFLIFPLQKLDKYFVASAKYRVKKSGSSNPSVTQEAELKKLFSGPSCHNSKVFRQGKELYAHVEDEREKIIVDTLEKSYQLSKVEDCTYRITRLSQTYNANVIFSISLKKFVQDESDLEEFRVFLELPL